MNVTCWVNEHLEQGDAVYLIADPNHESRPLVSFAEHGGQDARPMLDEQRFVNASEQGPWLLPVHPQHIGWLDKASEAGVVVASQHPTEFTVRHFSSLYEANLGGHIVLFPFFQPTFIFPMLERMVNSERNAFLNQHDFAGQFHGQWMSYVSTSTVSISESYEYPWWDIQSHHVHQEDNVPLLLSNLKSWLWQHFPQVMETHVRQGNDVDAIILPFLSQTENSLSQRVLLAAVSVVTQVGLNISSSLVEVLTEQYKNDDIQYALLMFKQQIKHRGL